MTYQGSVHRQAIDVWTFANDCTDCDVMAPVGGQKIRSIGRTIRGKECLNPGVRRVRGDFELVWRNAKSDEEQGFR